MHAQAPHRHREPGHEHDEYGRTDQGWKLRSVVNTRLGIDALEVGLPPLFG